MGLFSLCCYNRAMKNLFMFKNALIYLMVSALFSPLAFAEPVSDLYKTVVPVSGQGANERLRAMSVGLEKVLIKVTGDSQVLLKMGGTDAFSNAKRYVTQYGYVSDRNSLADDPSESPAIGLSLSFAESSIDRLLRQYQLQIWPSDRPGLLVWAVVDDPVMGKNFISAETLPEAVEALERLMGDRGAPLILPLLDLQDQQAVSVGDVWNLNPVKLAAAAKRYDTEFWLALRLYKSSTGQWRGARLLNLKGDENLSTLSASSLSELMNQVVPEVVDSLASRYAYTPNLVNEELLVQIENIVDYKVFNKVTSYFESLEVVNHLTVDYVDNDRLGLRLYVEGDVDLLLNTLRRDRRLAELVDVDIPSSQVRVPVPVTTTPALEESMPNPELSEPVQAAPTPVPAVIKRYHFRWGGR